MQPTIWSSYWQIAHESAISRLRKKGVIREADRRFLLALFDPIVPAARNKEKK